MNSAVHFRTHTSLPSNRISLAPCLQLRTSPGSSQQSRRRQLGHETEPQLALKCRRALNGVEDTDFGLNGVQRRLESMAKIRKSIRAIC